MYERFGDHLLFFACATTALARLLVELEQLKQRKLLAPVLAAARVHVLNCAQRHLSRDALHLRSTRDLLNMH